MWRLYEVHLEPLVSAQLWKGVRRALVRWEWNVQHDDTKVISERLVSTTIRGQAWPAMYGHSPGKHMVSTLLSGQLGSIQELQHQPASNDTRLTHFRNVPP
jgi:hypothetical protein